MKLAPVPLTLAAIAAASAAPASAESLRDALAGAYSNNPTLQAARAQQRATDETETLEKASGRPSLNATAQHIEFLKTSPNSFTAPERLLSVTPSLTVPIYSGGAVRNGIKAAKDRIKAGQADLRATESAIFAQVVAAYMDVLRNEALMQLSQNQVEVLTVNLEATQDRFEIGDLTRTDVAQSQARLEQARGDLRGAQANLISARETYLELVGRPANALEPPPPLPGLPETIEQAVEIALEHNPDLIAARERARASERDIDVASASRHPQVSLFAGADYRNYFGTLGGVLSSSLSQRETTANAGIRLTIPIYQGGRPAALERQAQARASAALENLVGAERRVIAQTRSAWSSWRAAQAIIESSQAAVKAAELSLEGVRAENSIGNRTILDVLNAEQELLSSRVQLITARRNAYVAGFSLLAAMGRAEARDLNLDVGGPLYDPQAHYDSVRDRVLDWGGGEDPIARSKSTVDIPAADATVSDRVGPVDELRDPR